MNEIQHSAFAVGNEPHCAWAWNLSERNLRFLGGIDDGYFEYIAATHLKHIETDNEQRAAVALRANYHLSLETLFGLIGAALQAPDCAVGWVLKARTERLRPVIQALSNRNMIFPIKWRLAVPLGFDQVAELILQYTPWAQESDGTVKRFAALWARLASDFLNPKTIAEYNSIKHGFRVRAGGFALRWGAKHEYGVSPPEEEMSNWTGSVFGTSFYSADPIGNHTGKDPHFTLRQSSLNWLPDATAARMRLAAMSIKNVRSFLTVANGRKPSEAPFVRPGDPSAFDGPWQQPPGAMSFDVDLVVEENHIWRMSREELQSILQSRSTPPE